MNECTIMNNCNIYIFCFLLTVVVFVDCFLFVCAGFFPPFFDLSSQVVIGVAILSHTCVAFHTYCQLQEPDATQQN